MIKKKSYINTPVDSDLFAEFKTAVTSKKLNINTILELFMKDFTTGEISIKFEMNDDDIVVPKLKYKGD